MCQSIIIDHSIYVLLTCVSTREGRAVYLEISLTFEKCLK